MISEMKIAHHKFECLKHELDKEKTWTLGDGRTQISSSSMVTLTWHNTYDAMKTYTMDFYVVEADFFDMLLGKEFYQVHGAPLRKATTEEYMMMGILDPIRRLKGK